MVSMPSLKDYNNRLVQTAGESRARPRRELATRRRRESLRNLNGFGPSKLRIREYSGPGRVLKSTDELRIPEYSGAIPRTGQQERIREQNRAHFPRASGLATRHTPGP